MQPEYIREAAALINRAELLAIGTRFDDRVSRRLGIDPTEIDKNVAATVPVRGDCKETRDGEVVKAQMRGKGCNCEYPNGPPGFLTLLV